MSHFEQSQFDYAAYEKSAPAVVNAMRTLGKAVDDSGLDKSLSELLKIRVSQINGCIFCLQLHLNLARKLGMPPGKIDLVATWKEGDIYSERERAALAWAEALTHMAGQSISTAVHEELERHFSSSEIGFLTAAIANINAWNRIAGGLRFPPPIPSRQLAAKEDKA